MYWLQSLSVECGMNTGCLKIFKKAAQFDEYNTFIPPHRRGEDIQLFRGDDDDDDNDNDDDDDDDKDDQDVSWLLCPTVAMTPATTVWATAGAAAGTSATPPPASASRVELQTNLCVYFTITEKAPTGN